MLYLIEGADGLGKTTLAKSLQWNQRTAYVHHCPPQNWKRGLFFDVIESYDAVYDRFHWSMWAYKEVNKQPLDLSMDDCAEIDNRLRYKLGGDYATVCLYASDPNYFDSTEVDHMLSKAAIKSVNDRYISALEHFDVVIDVATTGYPSAEQILDLIRL